MKSICLILAFFGISAFAASREIFVGAADAPLPGDGGLQDHEIALTIDDGPDPDLTPKVLAALKKHGVHANFFETGEHAEAHPELSRQVLREGHSLGSHSWDHADLTVLPLADALANIQHGRTAVETASGATTIFFRFPFFYSTPDLVSGIAKMGLLAFDASIFPDDWLVPDPKELLQRALDAVEANHHGLILLHDTQPQTAAMLDDFLTEIEARGYGTVVFRQRISATHSSRPGSPKSPPRKHFAALKY
jgi:peptidoglycan/xylan/chitin deacetylase (PgdA/CDA1 family)